MSTHGPICKAKLGAASRLAAVLFDDSAELDDAGCGMQAGSVKAYQSFLGASYQSHQTGAATQKEPVAVRKGVAFRLRQNAT